MEIKDIKKKTSVVVQRTNIVRELALEKWNYHYHQLIYVLGSNFGYYWNHNLPDYLINQDKNSFILTEYRRHLAAYKIQKWWKSKYWSPHTQVGIKRFNREYDKLYSDM